MSSRTQLWNDISTTLLFRLASHQQHRTIVMGRPYAGQTPSESSGASLTKLVSSLFGSPQGTRDTCRKDATWDVVIIGAGLCGLRMAQRLKEKHPTWAILVLESDARVGGVLRTLPPLGPADLKSNPFRRGCDMAAMRYFPNTMPLVAALVQELDLDTVQVPVTNLKSMLFAFGRRAPVLTYFSPELSPANIVANNSEAQIASILDKKTYSPKLLVPFKNRAKISADPFLSQQTYFSAYVPHKVDSTTASYYNFTSGYEGFVAGAMSAATSLTETSSVGRGSQVSVRKGMEAITNRLAAKISSAVLVSPSRHERDSWYRRFRRNRGGVLICLSSAVESIRPFGGANHVVRLKQCRDEVKTSRVAVCTPPLPAREILKGHPSFTESMADNFGEANFVFYIAFKLFLYYDEPWWPEDVVGRSLSESPMGQLWMYDRNTLLVYCSYDNAEYWISLFGLPRNENRTGDRWVDMDPKAIASSWFSRATSLFREVFPHMEVDRHPQSYAWSAFRTQVPLWAARGEGSGDGTPNARNKVGSIMQRRAAVRFPLQTQSVVYIHNATSLWQGWMEGSLEEADRVVDHEAKLLF